MKELRALTAATAFKIGKWNWSRAEATHFGNDKLADEFHLRLLLANCGFSGSDINVNLIRECSTANSGAGAAKWTGGIA